MLEKKMIFSTICYLLTHLLIQVISTVVMVPNVSEYLVKNLLTTIINMKMISHEYKMCL